MLRRVADRSFYFTFIVMFLLMCLALIFLYPGGHSFFILNGLFAEPLDLFFSYATHLGDGITSVVLCVLLIVFYNFGAGIVSLLGLGLCGVVSYIMKYYFFAVSPRPYHYFWENRTVIHYVNGVTINHENSFPSGHTLTAFFIFTFIVMLSLAKPALLQIVLAFLAITVAYSRVYLAQHFVEDILTGAAIGTVFALLFYKLYTRSKNIGFLNKNLIGMFRK